MKVEKEIKVRSLALYKSLSRHFGFQCPLKSSQTGGPRYSFFQFGGPRHSFFQFGSSDVYSVFKSL